MGEELRTARTLSHRRAPPRSRYRCDDRTIIRAVTPRAAASSLTPTRRAASEGRLEGAGLREVGQEVCQCVCVSLCVRAQEADGASSRLEQEIFFSRPSRCVFYASRGEKTKAFCCCSSGLRPVISRFFGSSSEPATPHVLLRVSSRPDLFLTCKAQ